MEFNVNPEYTPETIEFLKVAGAPPADPLALFPPQQEEEVKKEEWLGSPGVTEIDLSEKMTDELYDETALALDARDSVRLMNAVKSFIEQCMLLTLFELNDENSQRVFTKQVEGYLEEIRIRGAITDFVVVCDATNNVPEIVDSNVFVADIYIAPTKSPNYIQLNFVAQPASVDFDEIDVDEDGDSDIRFMVGDGDDDEDNVLFEGWNYNE